MTPSVDPRSSPGRSDAAFVVRWTRWAIVAGVAVGTVLALLWVLKGALTPLAVAFFIAYLLDPLIDRFEAWGVPRRPAILALMALLGVGAVTSLLLIVPALQRDLGALARSLPHYLEQLQVIVIPELEKRFDVKLPNSLREVIQGMSNGSIPVPLDTIQSFITASLSYLTGTFNTLIGLLVIPILAYYVTVDFDRITNSAAAWTPPRYRPYLVEKARTVNALISGFLRGQLTVATTLGALYALGFSVIGIDLAVGVGLLAGALALVPYLGNIVAVLTAGSLCILKFGLDWHLIAVVGWYVTVQCLEGFVLTPAIVGHSVGLNPAIVIVSLLIGGDLFGFLGLLIAVPGAAVIKVFVDELLEDYRNSTWFTEVGDAALTAELDPGRPAELPPKIDA